MANKLTNGWLCRDAGTGHVVFFPEPHLDELSGRWLYSNEHNVWRCYRWRKLYDLEPPAKGKKFYVSIQL